MKVNRVVCRDARAFFEELPDACADLIVTSPPYYNLRNYGGVANQIGLELTPDAYLDRLWAVFEAAARVLKPTGSLYVVIDDTYASARGRYFTRPHTLRGKATGEPSEHRDLRKTGYMDGCMLMIPARFAIGMIDRGWRLRNKLIWHKPNAMPESVTTRFTKDYEEVLFFVRGEYPYYFDFHAVQEMQSDVSVKRQRRARGGNGKYADGTGLRPQSIARVALPNDPSRAVGTTRRRRSVWSIPTSNSRLAHHATYPESLVEIMIKASSQTGGLVIDPFCGTGTTGVVARMLGREYLMCDINPDYVVIAESRLQEPYQPILLHEGK